jgi:tRNA(Arg) A34 adenosine deaminase TadA
MKYRFYYLVGCVIIHNDSKILASGQNEPVRLKNATRHAEMCALDTLFAQYDLSTARKVCLNIFNSFSYLLII